MDMVAKENDEIEIIIKDSLYYVEVEEGREMM